MRALALGCNAWRTKSISENLKLAQDTGCS
jgi:hypothetical protein